VSETCDMMRINLGAYVLGALEAAERAQTETHLATCQACRDELVHLAGLPGLLSRLTLAEAAGFAAGHDTAGSDAGSLGGLRWAADHADRALVALARRRRRTQRRAIAAVAAALLVIGGITAAMERSTSGRTLTASGWGGTVTATVHLVPAASGTALDLRLSGVPAEEHCELVAVDTEGRRETAATWVANYDGDASVHGHTAIPADQLASLEVVSPEDGMLVALEAR